MPPSSTDPLEDGFAAAPEMTGNAEEGIEAMEDDLLSDKEWVLFFKDALTASSNFQQSKLRSSWSRNYRAFTNRHMNGSKYESFRYRHRSKLFKPKTRAAVRKNDATAASALFSTEDVVSITPERASDRVQVMSARFIHEALNYRLDRNGRMTGPSWFMTAIGARQDSQITGICISKQYWQFEERDVDVLVERDVLDENGFPVLDEMGLPMVEEAIETETETVYDRIMIDLIPGEHGYVDPTADWRDPIQTGGYFICAYPTRKEDLMHMVEQAASRNKMGGSAWRTDIDIEKVIDQGQGAEQRQAESVRRAREDGVDRYESRHADANGEVIWIYECFYRYGGSDWQFWMLGETIMLSDPVPVEEAYPALKGDRPYVAGVGSLESHKTHPTAPVETWQQLQQELNDITNIRLDAMKMGISPITKIKRGRNIDFKQVQNRGPDAMIMVEDDDDVTFDRAPTPPSSTQLDLNNLNVDFDELAGVFSQGSVQTNRQLNETVGGMNLLAGASNSMTEFDLRIWVETWVEPVLRQCVRNIQYYESSETVIGVAGEKAGLLSNLTAPASEDALDNKKQEDQDESLPPVPLSVVMEQLEDAPISVRVNVGIGAMDSRQKLEKFMAGTKMTMEMLPILAADQIQPDAKEMVQEAWGLLGYKDAARFFKKTKPQEKGPPEAVQLEMIKQKGRQAEKKADAQIKGAEMKSKERIEGIKAQLDHFEQAMKQGQFDREQGLAEREFEHEKRMDYFDASMKAMQSQLDEMARQMDQRRQSLPNQG